MTPILAYDSWWAPSPQAIAYAKSKGVQAWLGYLKQSPTDHIYAGWSVADFAAVAAAGLHTGAYCSGWDDPGWVKQQAESIGVVAILDCETSIREVSLQHGLDRYVARHSWLSLVRSTGPWVDPWLAASGAALYALGGDVAQHVTHGHTGYVVAGYPSNSGTPNPVDPGLNWSGLSPLPNPARPIGRQWAGSVPTPYGGVDYSWFDPAFFAQGDPDAMTNDLANALAFVEFVVALGRVPSQADLASRAAEILAKGATPVLWELTGSAEGVATGGIAGKVAALQAQKPVPGPAGPPGPPGAQGPPGTAAPFTATITPH